MSEGFVDVNVNVGRWPFRRLPLDETAKLAEKLAKLGVEQAWAGSFEALLHRDVAGVNERLAEECRKQGKGVLEPFGCVNPSFRDWDEDLRRCAEVHGMKGVRVYPGWHGYGVDSAEMSRVIGAATERRLIVQVVVAMEDERTWHPLVKPGVVEVAKLPEVIRKAPGARVILLNALRAVRGTLFRELIDAGEVYFDIATQEGMMGVANLLKIIPAERVLFGSHAPFFYPEAAVLKMKEAELAADVFATVARANATRLIGGNPGGK